MKQGMWIKSGITMGCASFRGKVTLPRFSAVLFMMASLLLASCKQPVGGDPTPPTPIPETNRALLLALGITPDESPPTTAGGDLVSGVMNPLGKKRSNLFTQYELFQAGASFPGLSRYFALDVPANGTTNQFAVYATTEEGGAGAWLSLPKKSLAADLDGDGTDEIVTALFDGQNGTITFKISRATGTMQTKILSNLTWMGNFGQGYSGGREWHHDNYFMRDFTVGDFNNDGRPDFVLSCMKTVLILNSSLDIVGSFEVDDTQADDPYVRVEAGDLNGDDFDDLVVVNGRRKESNGQSRYYIFAGSLQGLGIGLNATVTNHAEIVTGSLPMAQHHGRSYCLGQDGRGSLCGSENLVLQFPEPASLDRSGQYRQ
ncbi:MAG: hypothetical protein A3J97_01405 [Spirochaetes bacterium RIFOXYC1_FULL_54_7]|nr:MAG: hypothetical protein A3J97_01405 [Spirochaetes bacterium RIFOXYC1_FULL_54_7]